MIDEQQENTRPMDEDKDVKKASDPQIDKDFEGFPDNLSSENIINPKTEAEKKTAGLSRDPMSEYEDHHTNDKNAINELDSDGSGGAFSQTEQVDDDEGFVREDPDEPNY